MTRKLLATGIAVVICIPLIPVLKKGFGYLTGTDSPMVFAARGWTLEKPKSPVGPAQVGIDLAPAASMKFEARGAADGERVWIVVRPGPNAWSFGTPLHDTRGAGDSKFEVSAVVDSGMNRAMPTGVFGGYYFGFPTPPSVWAGLSLDSDGDGIPDEALRSYAYGILDRKLLENLDPFKGGDNLYASYLPLLRVGPPTGAVAGSTTVALSRTRSGFAPGAVVVFDSSESMASSRYSAVTFAHELGHVSNTGWYSLSVANQSSQTLRDIDVEFAPDSGGASVRYKLKDSGTGGTEAGWIHLNEPGSVFIRGDAEAKLNSMGYAEFISRAFDITLQKALLTVFLLAEVLPLSAWILVIWKVRSYAYKKISLLPRLERKPARHEVEFMLSFAKWSGVSCYVLWTAKDILAGAGIVFAGG